MASPADTGSVLLGRRANGLATFLQPPAARGSDVGGLPRQDLPPSDPREPGSSNSGRRPRFATLLLGLVLAVLLPALAVGVAATWRAATAERAGAEARLRDTARALELVVDLELAKHLAAAEAFAVAASGQDAATPDVTALDARARMLARQSAMTLSVVRQDGSRVLTTLGRPGATTPPVNAGELISKVFATGQSAIGNLIPGAVTGRPVIPAAAPILDADGKPVLAVEVSFRASRLSDLLVAEGLPEGSVAAVVDANNIIVAVSNDGIGQPMLPDSVRPLANDPSGMYCAMTRSGSERCFASFGVPAAPGWRVLVGQSMASLDAAWRVPMLMFGGGGAMVLALGVMLAMLTSRRILTPLGRLTRYASAVAAAGGETFDDQATAAMLPPANVAELEALRMGFAAAETALRRYAVAERRANAVSAARREEMRALFDASPVGIARCDMPGRILVANEAMLRMLGATQADLAAGRLTREKLTPPAFRGVAEQALAETLASPDGRSRPFEKEYIRPADGRRIPALVSMALMDRAAGEFATFVIDLTDIRHLDARLAESEARLRLFVDKAPAAIAMFDRDMRYLAVSQRFLSDYRVDAATSRSLVGRSHFELFPESAGRWREIHRRVLAGETVSMDDDPFPRRDGGVDWLRWEMTPWRQSDGSVGGAVLFSEVITARKEAEAALAESEERKRQLLATALEGIIVASAAGRIVSANPAAVQMFGYGSEAEMLGRPLAVLMPTEHAERHDTYLARHQTTGQARAIGVPGRELIGCRKDGTQFPLDLSVSSFRSGDATFYTGVLRDVTDRKQAEAALRESETRLRLATEVGQIAVFDEDLRTGTMRWDDRMLALWALPPEMPVTREVVDACVHPDDLPRKQALLHESIDAVSDGRYEAEYRVVGMTDGVTRHVSVRARVFFEDGFAVRRLGTVVDVTARREVEAVLARNQAELERLVVERTRDLEATQARLVSAAKMEALGRLAGGVAHDFNNVLQAVHGGVTLAGKRVRSDPAKAAGYLKLASDAAERGTAVTGRLLAFARRTELCAVPVDPRQLLEGLAEMLTPGLGPTVMLQPEVARACPCLFADEAQLETVLVNLINNARDALPNGRGVIRVIAEPTEGGAGTPVPPGRFVRIVVIDDGEGMSPDVLARVAEPFFTTKPKGQGTGLGLSMASGFAEQSGGALTIDSVPGRGTTVTLWLPVAADGIADQQEAEAADADEPPTGGLALLLVDDVPAVRMAVAEMLAEFGHTVTQADNADAALALLDAGVRADALVTDLSMPGRLDGLGLVQEARQRRPGLPTVLITGHVGDAGDDTLAMVEQSGPFAVLRKPFTAVALAAQVAALAG